MRKKKHLSLFMILAIVIAFIPTVEISGSAAQLRERLRQIEQQRDHARNQVRETENLLTGFRAEIEELLEVMRDYSQRMIDAHADLEEIELVLLDTELNRIYAEEELVQARIDRDRQEKLFRDRLRAMHERGTAGYLDVLFQATSFSDFLVRLEHVRTISQFDQEVLVGMEKAEERVANHVDDLTRLNILFEYMHLQQQDAILALDDAIEANTIFLVSLQENEAQAALLAELEAATLQAINEEFEIVERQWREQENREEAERQAAALRARNAERPRVNLAHLDDPSRNFAWPVPTHREISSPFGSRTHPIRRTPEHHTGIDIPAPGGTRIVAAADGYVRLAAWHGGFGLTVIIDHGNGYSTLYAHNSRNRVSVGQRVNRGQHIADVGTTGVSTGNHLHFEIRRNGIPVNPMQYF